MVKRQDCALLWGSGYDRFTSSRLFNGSAFTLVDDRVNVFSDIVCHINITLRSDIIISDIVISNITNDRIILILEFVQEPFVVADGLGMHSAIIALHIKRYTGVVTWRDANVGREVLVLFKPLRASFLVKFSDIGAVNEIDYCL